MASIEAPKRQQLLDFEQHLCPAIRVGKEILDVGKSTPGSLAMG